MDGGGERKGWRHSQENYGLAPPLEAPSQLSQTGAIVDQTPINFPLPSFLPHIPQTCFYLPTLPSSFPSSPPYILHLSATSLNRFPPLPSFTSSPLLHLFTFLTPHISPCRFLPLSPLPFAHPSPLVHLPTLVFSPTSSLHIPHFISPLHLLLSLHLLSSDPPLRRRRNSEGL